MYFSDRLTAALHVARVSGVATPAKVAELIGDADGVQEILDQAAADGLLRHRPTGVFAGWSLTPAGRAAHAERLRTDLDKCGFADRLRELDTGFVEINGPFKELCSRWQEQGDRDACVRTLEDLHERVSALLSDAARHDERFGLYRRRLDAALGRLRAGDDTAFLKPLSGSYHDVWMELHQDLIVTLCRERAGADGH